MSLPRVGDLLPRIADGFSEPIKWSGWILGSAGHADDWARMFGVDVENAPAVFAAIHTASPGQPIVNVRDLGRHGFTCGVDVTITLNGRSGQVRASWHYADEAAPPRLVTAYPRT